VRGFGKAETMTKRFRAIVVPLALGSIAWRWERASDYHFSAGSKYFAIAVTILWLFVAALVLSGKRLPWWPKREDWKDG